MTEAIRRRAPFLVLSLVVLAFAIFYRPQSYGIWADQMTYSLQANSIARDGDLQFDSTDLERFRRHGWDEPNPVGLYLRESDGRFFYSKPFLYSLAAAPLTWIAPVRGPVVLNALLFLLLVELTFRWYRRFNRASRAALVSILVWVACAAPFYIFILHTDLMIAALLALALYFWLTSPLPPEEAGETQNRSRLDRRDWKTSRGDRSVGRVILAGVFFGLAVYEKNPTVFFLGAAVASMLWKRAWRAAAVLIVVAAFNFALPTMVHFAQDGNFSPYQGNRVYCDAEFPFDNLQQATDQLAAHRHPGREFFEMRKWQSLMRPERLGQFFSDLPRDLGFYLAGRKTGLFPYLTPALVALVLWLIMGSWRRRGGDGVWLFLALIAYVFFYFFVLSAWYGGPTAIGNRYALQVLPAFLLLVRRFPRSRWGYGAVVAVLIAAGLYFPGYDLISPYGKIRDNIALFQKPRFRWLPFEWSLAWFLHDTDRAVVDFGERGKIVRLTDLNPTDDSYAYFLSSHRHQVAVVTRMPLDSYPVRIAARARPQAGWIRSGDNETVFSLGAYESAIVDIPLAVRGHAKYRWTDVYCHLIEFGTSTPLESNTIYPEDYYRRIGPFIDWLASDERPTSSVQIVPDEPRDSGRLLWGWLAPEAPVDGKRVRWAGEAKESAFVATIDPAADLLLQVAAETPVTVETTLVCNGIALDPQEIGPGKTNCRWTVAGDLLRKGENILAFRHDRLWQPAQLADSSRDHRWLAVHYLAITLRPADAMRSRD
jgi:hypothetical protein